MTHDDAHDLLKTTTTTTARTIHSTRTAVCERLSTGLALWRYVLRSAARRAGGGVAASYVSAATAATRTFALPRSCSPVVRSPSSPPVRPSVHPLAHPPQTVRPVVRSPGRRAFGARRPRVLPPPPPPPPDAAPENGRGGDGNARTPFRANLRRWRRFFVHAHTRRYYYVTIAITDYREAAPLCRAGTWPGTAAFLKSSDGNRFC